MGGGGLMQLVAYGAQDVYLSTKPQITFFKAVYKRHTNFAVEAIEQTFNGSPDFGRRVTCPITRNGDLVTKMYLMCTLKSATEAFKWSYSPNVGHQMIKNVELEVGGSRIDKQYGDWMNIWHELTRNPNHDAGYARMVGGRGAVDASGVELTDLALTHGEYTLYVPLQFFCCRNNGLALPLISLQYHDVRVNFEFANVSDVTCYQGGSAPTAPGFKSCQLLVDFVFLDSEERKRFAQSSHEYLIEQVQFTGEEAVSNTSVKARLNFNHPCKALFWVVKNGNHTGTDHLAWSTDAAKLAEENTILGVLNSSAVTGGDSSITVDSVTTITAGNTDYQVTYLGGASAVSPNNVDLNDFVVTGVTLSSANMSGGASTVLDHVHGSSATQNTTWADLNVTVNDPANYGTNMDGSDNPVTDGLLQLNGHDRFAKRDGEYFDTVQPFQHFSNTPSAGVNCYSFAASPEEHQPSGSCNFSRIDNAQLVLTVNSTVANATSSKLNVYAMNYNVLRVMSGMGGLAYSN